MGGGCRDMKYITHHRFRGPALCGQQLNIPYGTELGTEGFSIVLPDGRMVCYSTSENAKRHFARNDDGKGLERGALTHAVAYSRRDAGNGCRFTEAETETLVRDWPHFLRQDVDTVLFNERFFEADVEELKALASALNIKVRR